MNAKRLILDSNSWLTVHQGMTLPLWQAYPHFHSHSSFILLNQSWFCCIDNRRLYWLAWFMWHMLHGLIDVFTVWTQFVTPFCGLKGFKIWENKLTQTSFSQVCVLRWFLQFESGPMHKYWPSIVLLYY